MRLSLPKIPRTPMFRQHVATFVFLLTAAVPRAGNLPPKLVIYAKSTIGYFCHLPLLEFCLHATFNSNIRMFSFLIIIIL